MKYFLLCSAVVLFLSGCLHPMQEPQAEKVDSEVHCGFGTTDC